MKGREDVVQVSALSFTPFEKRVGSNGFLSRYHSCPLAVFRRLWHHRPLSFPIWTRLWTDWRTPSHAWLSDGETGKTNRFWVSLLLTCVFTGVWLPRPNDRDRMEHIHHQTTAHLLANDFGRFYKL